MELYSADDVVGLYDVLVNEAIVYASCLETALTAVVIVFVDPDNAVGDGRGGIHHECNIITDFNPVRIGFAYQHKRAAGYLALHTGSEDVSIAESEEVT